MAKYDVDLRDYWRIIRRRKTVIIMTVLLVSCFTFFFAKFNAPSPLYEATAAIKFERSTSVTGLFLEAISYSTGDPLATQTTIITGGPVMENVAKDMGLIDPGLSSQQIRRSEELSGIVANLENSVRAELIGGTNIINIVAAGSNPKTAQELANTVATVYRQHNIAEKNRRTKEARSFIQEQLKVIGGRLGAAEDRLKVYEKENRLVVTGQGVTSAIASVADLESQYQKVNHEIEETSLQLSNLKRGAAAFKIQNVFLEHISPSVSKLNSALLDLIVQRDTLLVNYTKKSPQIQEVESQIRDIKATLEQTLSSRAETLRGKRQALDSQLRKMYENIPEEHLGLVRLQREVTVNEDLFSLLKSKYQEALIKEAEQVEEVVIVKPALEPTEPVRSPKILAITLVGVVIGTILGLVVATVLESLDTSIGTIQDVEEFLNLPVLGIIPYSGIPEVKEALAEKFPKIKDEDTLSRYAYLLSHFAHDTHIAGSYQILRTNIQIGFIENGAKTLLITSSSPIEGKTVTIINLALGMAQMGKRVLLVEADIRKPKICRNFGIRGNQPGLVDVLMGNYNWPEVTKTISDIMLGQMTMKEIMLTPGIDNVDIMPAGLRHPNGAGIIGSSRMKDFVNEAKQKYDVVLLDSPPVLTSSDPAIMGTYVDGVIMVYKVGKIARRAIKRAKAQLEAVKAKVIGVVLNGVKPEISSDYDSLKYGYYYYSSDSHDFNSSSGKMLPSPKELWQKLGRGEENQASEKKHTSSDNKHGIVRCTLLILLLISLIGAIIWQHLGLEETQLSHSVTRKKILLPQEVSKTRSKVVGKVPAVKKEIERIDNISPATWLVEVASAIAYNKAKSMAISLKDRGFPAYISLANVNGQRWYRVRVGAYSSRAEAENMKGTIVKEFGKTDCWINFVR
jgi:succinoglycan biosynthesis transport protein ExoP